MVQKQIAVFLSCDLLVYVVGFFNVMLWWSSPNVWETSEFQCRETEFI